MVGGPQPLIQRIRSAVGSLVAFSSGRAVSAGQANLPFDRRATFFKLLHKITLGHELALPWTAGTHVLLATARLLRDCCFCRKHSAMRKLVTPNQFIRTSFFLRHSHTWSIVRALRVIPIVCF